MTMIKKLRYAIIRLLSPKVHNLLNPKYRAAIDAVKQKFKNKPLVGVEIGVAKGKNAEYILKTLNVKCLYLVDHYGAYIEDKEIVKNYQNSIYEATKIYKKYRDKLKWFSLESSYAKDYIPDDLDFVYIDANHTYENCLMDIINYYPKIKKGGIIGGHNFEHKFPGVIRAVANFAENQGVKFKVFKVDWWIIKNGSN